MWMLGGFSVSWIQKLSWDHIYFIPYYFNNHVLKRSISINVIHRHIWISNKYFNYITLQGGGGYHPSPLCALRYAVCPRPCFYQIDAFLYACVCYNCTLFRIKNKHFFGEKGVFTILLRRYILQFVDNCMRDAKHFKENIVAAFTHNLRCILHISCVLYVYVSPVCMFYYLAATTVKFDNKGVCLQSTYG